MRPDWSKNVLRRPQNAKIFCLPVSSEHFREAFILVLIGVLIGKMCGFGLLGFFTYLFLEVDVISVKILSSPLMVHYQITDVSNRPFNSP